MSLAEVAKVSRSFSLFAVAAITLAVAGIYGRAAGFGFVDYDDPVVVSENATVLKGLSQASLRYAFTDHSTNLWHPLTWLSHMADVEVFGAWAGGHHLLNVLLHLANAVLVYLLGYRLLRRQAAALVIALLFAAHPLHVESVAWISERKDVLSAFFYLSTVLAYLAWAERGRPVLYAAALACCVAGFMAKASLMTLPFALLLLDFWPLRRMEGTGWRAVAGLLGRRILEKAPFFGVTAVFMAVAWQVEAGGEHAGLAGLTGFTERVGVAALAYLSYLGRTFWPAGLAPFYPHPDGLDPVTVTFAVALLAGVSLAAIAFARRAPYVLFGWFWFVGLLFPASGIVTISDNFAPDRYTYLAHVGLFIALVAGALELASRLRVSSRVSAAFAAAVVALSGILCFQQTGFWRDSETLWTRAIAVTERNYFAHNKLAVIQLRDGRESEAVANLEASVAAKPDFAFAHANLGRLHEKRGDFAKAASHLERAIAVKPRDVRMRRALVRVLESADGDIAEIMPQYEAIAELDPGDAKALFVVGNHRYESGDGDGALAAYTTAARLAPDLPVLRGNLGVLLFERGEFEAAEGHLRAALDEARNPVVARAHFYLARVLRARGDLKSAVQHYGEAVERAPLRHDAANELAWLLATSPDAAIRDGHRAATLALHANKRSGDPNPAYLMTLGAAYAEEGDFKRAVEAVDFALRFLAGEAVAADSAEVETLRAQLAAQRASYEASRPIRESKTPFVAKL